jgi:SAM-dependent methyltransferase
MDLALRHLGPPRRGLEIGASANNPFPGLRAWQLEQPASDVFGTAQERLAGGRARVDVLADAANLPLRDGALPWLLASHVLEHMPDTIAALLAWDRAVAVGGTLFLIVPHRERTFDRDRPRTELAHHLADWALGMSVVASPMSPTSHYHVWITEDLLLLIEWLGGHGLLDWELLEVEDVDSKVGNGFTIVARKRSARPRPPAPGPVAALDGPPDFHLLTLDLPFQVPGRTLESIVHGAEPRAPPGLPRGRFRAVPFRSGLPPRAGPTVTLDVGAAVPPPTLDALTREGALARFRGAHLTPTTYLRVDLGDGVPRHVLPTWEDGALVVDTTGLHHPSGRVRVAAVNLPPGGGQGPWLTL